MYFRRRGILGGSRRKRLRLHRRFTGRLGSPWRWPSKSQIKSVGAAASIGMNPRALLGHGNRAGCVLYMHHLERA